MQHYAIFLQAYQHDIQYKNTKLHGNADALSRLPTNSVEIVDYGVADFAEINQINSMPINVNMIASKTRKDNSLLPLLQGLKWGTLVGKAQRFHINQSEFSLQQGCIMRG